MFRSILSTSGVLLLTVLAGCGDPSEGALYVNIGYATRCDISPAGCAGATSRTICGFSGGDPCEAGRPTVNASCNVIENEPTTRSVSFSAVQGGGFSIRISNLVVPYTGGSSMGGACRVQVVEGANTYEGACGGSVPSEEQPCQITSVNFIDDNGNATVEGRVFCQHLKHKANPTLEIEVTQNGTGSDAASRPAFFQIANCEGLTCTEDSCTQL
jgi:hypothetical protein